LLPKAAYIAAAGEKMVSKNQ